MATRTVSTKLAIEGEAQYKASLASINSELKSLQSALKLTESEYAGNANSMAALTAKEEALNKLHAAQAEKVKELRKALENAQNAVATYSSKKETLTAKIEANNKALEALKNTTGDTTAEQAKLEAENAKLNEELQKNDQYLAAAQKGVNGWQTQLNGAQVDLNNLDSELQKNDKYMDEAANSADGCADSIDEFGKETKDSKDAVSDLQQALASAGLIAAIKAVSEALDACVDSSIEFESAMAGVAKTTDLSADELSAMSEEIKNLSTEIPLTTTELANITEVAGQLGVAKDDLLEFTTVMANLGVATNMTSDEAATMLAQLVAITGMDTSQYENLGSAIVALGNNFATNERKITDMTQSIAAAATNAGMTEAEMLALSTAVTSVGIEAANGGTQMNKLISEMQAAVETGEGLNDWAAAAGMSAEEFSDLWGRSAVDAIAAFIGNLNNLDSSATVTLSTLGITETRMKTMITSLANAEGSTGMLTRAVDTANKAWDENTALVNEASTRYETTESKMTLLSNSFNNLKIAVGDQLTPALGDFAEVGADVLQWATDVVSENEALVPILTAVTVAFATLAAGIAAYTVVTKLAAAASAAFTAILDTNPIFLAITAIAALAAGIAVLVSTINDSAVPSVEELTTAASECAAAFEETEATYAATEDAINGAANLAETYAKRLAELEEQGLTTNDAQNEYRLTVDKLNSILPDLNLTIDEQTGIIEGGTDALLDNIDAWKEVALQEALATKYSDEIDAWAAAELEVYENQVKLNNAIAEGSVLQDQYAAIQAEMTANADAQVAALDDSTMSAQEQTLAVWELEDEWNALWDKLMETQGAINDNTDYQENLTEAIEEGSAVVAEHETTVNDAREALDAFTEAEGNAADAAGENAEAQDAASESVSNITERINDLAQAYKDAYDSAYDSINGQIGLFDTFAAEISEDTDTVEEMMARWSEQTANLASYTENLKLAAQYGLDEGLVLSLSDGSAESAGYLATIIDKIEELGGTTEGMSTDAQTFVDDFNAAFAGTEEAKVSFADTVATIETDFNDALASIEQAAADADFSGFTEALETAFSNVDVDFNSIGKDAGSGLASGIEDSSGSVESAAEDMAQGAVDGARSTLDSHSDSRVMIAVGRDFTGGMITGIEERESELVQTVQNLGEEITRIMTESATGTVDDYIREFNKLASRTQSELTSLKTTVTSSMQSLPGEMNSVGANMVNGMINGLNSRSSSLYSTVSGIVNTAIARAKSAAATASPSKKTTKIFEDVGEGMVVGLENKRKKIADTAQDVVNVALDLDTSDAVSKAISTIDDSIPDVTRSTSGDNGDNRSYKIENRFNIEKVEVRKDTDIVEVAEALYDLQQKEMRKRGIVSV